MANTYKGFIEIPKIADNASGSVAQLGELSTEARTYAREKQFAAMDTHPGIEFIIFNALDENGAKVSDIPPASVEPALALSKNILDNFTGADTLANWLNANAGSEYSSFSLGNVILQGTVRLPTSLRFTYSEGGNSDDYILWFSNQNFMTEYDVSETYIVPPVDPVTNLYQSYTGAFASVSAITYIDQIQMLNASQGTNPPTDVSTYTLKWNDPDDLSQQFTTTWTVLSHGREGGRTDLVLEAIREYLTENTAYSVEEWRRYLPDIRTLDVFNIVPLWDRVALQAGPGIDSLYRPIFKLNQVALPVTTLLIGRTTSEVESLGEAFPLLFRNLPVVVMPGSANEVNKKSFIGVFPDYTVIPLNDQSANRLTALTQSVIQTLDSLARAAEVDTGVQALPTGITRNLISGVPFLEKADNNIVYRMVTRKAYSDRV